MELHENPESKGWVIATAMPDPVFLEHPLYSWKSALALALSGDNDLSSWIGESKWRPNCLLGLSRLDMATCCLKLFGFVTDKVVSRTEMFKVS